MITTSIAWRSPCQSERGITDHWGRSVAPNVAAVRTSELPQLSLLPCPGLGSRFPGEVHRYLTLGCFVQFQSKHSLSAEGLPRQWTLGGDPQARSA